MKKFIYPIAAIFALITVASFSSDDCRTKYARKEAGNAHAQKTRNLHGQGTMPEISTVKSQIQGSVTTVGSQPVVNLLVGLETFDLSTKESDIQIDIQFSREETTIEVPDVLNADESVTYQFNAENGAMLAYRAAF